MTVDTPTFKELISNDLLEFINIQDINNLIELIGDENGLISLPNLVKSIPFWNSMHNR